MFAIVSVNIHNINLIVTNHSNIDWITKELEDNCDILEFQFPIGSKINIFDIMTNNHRVMDIENVDENIHRLLIDKKMYVILHKI